MKVFILVSSSRAIKLRLFRGLLPVEDILKGDEEREERGAGLQVERAVLCV